MAMQILRHTLFYSKFYSVEQGQKAREAHSSIQASGQLVTSSTH